MTWLAVIGSALTLLLFLARWIVRVKSERRKLADEAKKKWDEGNQTPSDLLDTMSRLKRLR